MFSLPDLSLSHPPTTTLDLPSAPLAGNVSEVYLAPSAAMSTPEDHRPSSQNPKQGHKRQRVSQMGDWRECCLKDRPTNLAEMTTTPDIDTIMNRFFSTNFLTFWQTKCQHQKVHGHVPDWWEACKSQISNSQVNALAFVFSVHFYID
jgi:hypothetical protein